MRRLFDFDSPVIQALTWIADIFVLNLLTLICSVPIVTYGASQTALYDVCGKMIRKEGTIWKSYWNSFRSNFKKSTILGIAFAIAIYGCISSLIFFISSGSAFRYIGITATGVCLFLIISMKIWSFALQSRFENTVRQTIRNALLCTLSHLPMTVLMVAVNVLPLAVAYFSLELFVRWTMLWLLCWFSMTVYMNRLLMRKTFDLFEEMVLDETQDDSDKV